MEAARGCKGANVALLTCRLPSHSSALHFCPFSHQDTPRKRLLPLVGLTALEVVCPPVTLWLLWLVLQSAHNTR